MRKTSYILFLFLLFFILAPPLTSAESNDLAWCASQWPNDYSMQEHCLKMQKDAYINFKSWAVGNGVLVENDDGGASFNKDINDLVKITLVCLDEWRVPQYDTVDFSMAWFCIQQQHKAYLRLHPQEN